MCAQCDGYPCLKSCPTEALSIDERTTAVIVNREKCMSCDECITACSGQIPFLHPKDNKATICDFCGGDPECVKVCTEANHNTLTLVEEKQNVARKLFARRPLAVAKDLAVNLFGEKGEEVI